MTFQIINKTNYWDWLCKLDVVVPQNDNIRLHVVSRKGKAAPLLKKANPRTRNYKASRWITSALCLLAFLFYAFQLADYSSKQAVVNQELVNCEGRDCYGTPD